MNKRSNPVHPGIKIGLGVIVAGLTIGVGTGALVEGHTNEVANGKDITAQTCLAAIPHESTINKSMLDCFHHGVPGGNSAHAGELKVGQPISFVDAYIQAQQTEAAHVETERLTLWGITPFIVAIGAIAL